MAESIEAKEKYQIVRGAMMKKILNAKAYIGNLSGLIYDDSTKDNLVGLYMQFYGKDAEKVADYMRVRSSKKQLKVKITIEEVESDNS